MSTRSRILIVDDNPTNVAILEEMLETDYLLATAASGSETLAIAPIFNPDLILLDVMMPGMDGYETCRRLRTCPGLKHTKIMMVSAKIRLDERLQGYEAGADDYVGKPFDQDELLAKVRVYLRLKSIEEINGLKSELLRWLGDETRTPLAGILAPVQLLKTQPGMAFEQQQHYFETMHQSACRLHNLLAKVMRLSDLKARTQSFNFLTSSLSALVRTALGKVEGDATEKRVRLKLSLPDIDPVQLDPVEMEQALTTLLQYAIRLSPIDSDVSIALSQEDTQACLVISDQSDGIDAAFLPHIFDEFAFSDEVLLTEGQGLSLAITRQIVLAHSGTIRVQSTRNVGTTFTLRLPTVTLPVAMA